jgi:ABC transport system ATP-binding/permease protein
MAEKNPRSRNILSSTIGAVIEFVAGEEQGRQVPLIYAKTALGRKFGDILIHDIKVSGTHASIEYRKNRFFIVDLGSANGTFLHGKKVHEAPLDEGDVVRIGLSAFKLMLDPKLAEQLVAKRPPKTALREGGLTELIDQEFLSDRGAETSERTARPNASSSAGLLFVCLEGPTRGHKFIIENQSTVIGRMNADVNLKDPDVSRKHALIERQEGGQIVLRDLESRNGTFVNQQRISNCVLSKGDQIRMGQSVLIFNGWLTA